MPHFNVGAIVAAALVGMLIGSLGIALFESTWSRLSGFTPQQVATMRRSRLRGLGILAVELAAAAGLWWFVQVLGVGRSIGVLEFAGWSFVAFIGPSTIAPVLWGSRSIAWWLFTSAFNLLGLVAMIGILAAWR
jgi:hypothetical protein